MAQSSGRLGKARRALLRHETTDIIREGILSNQFSPEDALVERELAAEIGVSRTAIREALIKLEAQGLVTSVPHKGWFVARLTPEDIWEICTLRSLLEGFATRLVTEKATEESLAEFAEQLAMAVTARDLALMQALMNEEFGFAFWGSEGYRVSREQAMADLQSNYLPAEMTISFDVETPDLSLYAHGAGWATHVDLTASPEEEEGGSR